MRSLEKNKRSIWFSNPVVSGEDETGNDVLTYSDPIHAMLNISAPTGYAYGTENGIWLGYDYVITVTCKEFGLLKFVEGKTLVWHNKTPQDGSANLIVDRVADSINQVRIGLKHR